MCNNCLVTIMLFLHNSVMYGWLYDVLRFYDDPVEAAILYLCQPSVDFVKLFSSSKLFVANHLTEIQSDSNIIK